MNFSDKIIWITGASSGIGKALALELSNQNAKIILSSRKIEDLELVKSEGDISVYEALFRPSNILVRFHHK